MGSGAGSAVVLISVISGQISAGWAVVVVCMMIGGLAALGLHNVSKKGEVVRSDYVLAFVVSACAVWAACWSVYDWVAARGGG